MRIESPLSNLRDVLLKARASSENYKATLKDNEAATRAVLIDPVLRALGWDTANTYMVEVEKITGDVRADYALYDNNGTVKIIVEAKKLGTNLGKFQLDLPKYAFGFGLNNIFLTDGVIWWHYKDTFNPSSFSPHKKLNLATDNLNEVTSYFAQELDAAMLWPDDGGVDALAQQLAQLQSDFATLQQQASAATLSIPQSVQTDAIIRSSIQEPGVPMPSVLSVTSSKPYVPLSDLVNDAGKALVDLTGTSPSWYLLPDGREIEVTKWKHVLVETCKCVLANNSDIVLPYPDRSGKKINLFSITRPPTGIASLEVHYAGQTIFVFTNYDSNNCVSNSIHALKLFPPSLQVIEPAVVYS